MGYGFNVRQEGLDEERHCVVSMFSEVNPSPHRFSCPDLDDQQTLASMSKQLNVEVGENAHSDLRKAHSDYEVQPRDLEINLPKKFDLIKAKKSFKRQRSKRELRFGSIFEGQSTRPPPTISKPLLEVSKRGGVSISFALVLVFGLSVAILGSGLIAVSWNFLVHSHGLQTRGSEDIQAILLNLVNESRSDLEQVTNQSVNQLIRVVLDQVYRRTEESVDNYTRWCEFCVLEMVDLWNEGLLTPDDLDLSRHQLWKVLMRFGSVTRVGFADHARGNYVGIQRLVDGGYDLEIRNESGSICRECLPGALGTYKYYFNVSTPYQETGWIYNGKKVNDPRTRPWYVAAMQGNGTGRWSPAYTLSRGSTVAMTAGQAILSKNGAVEGVVAADLALEFISSFLQEIQLQLRVKLGNQYEGGDLHIVALDPNGNLLGTSSNDTNALVIDGTLQQVSWSVGIKTLVIREGIQIVNDYWQGNWSLACSPSYNDDYRTYPSNDLLIASNAFSHSWGLRLVLIAIVRADEYRGQIDAVMHDTIVRINNRSHQTKNLISGISNQVNEALTMNQATEVSISLAFVILGSILVNLFALRISRPLEDLAARMEKVAVLDFSQGTAISFRSLREVGTIGDSFKLMSTNLRSFALYVPEAVVRLLVNNGTVAKLGVEPREVSIFFSDIAGFTSIAESLPPEVMIRLLAEYLEAMSNCIEESRGTVGKYIGDAIMAFWNSPDFIPHHCNAACSSALFQQVRLKELRERWSAQGLPELHVRMGLSTGVVLHGNIGSKCRMEWGLIGDEVNLTSRLEGMCKEYGVDILISGKMYRTVSNKFLARPIDKVVAYGKKTSTEIYELVASRDQATAEQIMYCDDFNRIVESYRSRQFVLARILSVQFHKSFPNDSVAAKYIQRCDHYVANPPPEDWDFTFVFNSK